MQPIQPSQLIHNFGIRDMTVWFYWLQSFINPSGSITYDWLKHALILYDSKT